MRISPKTQDMIRTLRDCVRHDEGGGGQCALVVQELMELPDFAGSESTAGYFVNKNGDIVDDHWWIILPDSSIFDPTQDQFGDGGFGDIIHASKKDPRHAHYFPYSAEPGISMDALQFADKIKGLQRQTKNRSFSEMVEDWGGRPVGHPNRQSPGVIPDYLTDGGFEGVPEDEEDEEFKPEEFEAKLADLMDHEGEQEPYINAHKSGPVMWIDMFYVPPSQRRQGIGTELYQRWESSLPSDIRVIKLMAADTGDGPSDDFWSSLGFEYAIQDPEDHEMSPYEARQQMVKHLENGNVREVDHPEYMPSGDETHGYNPAYDLPYDERQPGYNRGHPKP